MVDQGLINDKTFSVYLDKESNTGFVEFGEPNALSISSAYDLEYVIMTDGFFWSALNEGIGIGSTTNSTFAFENTEIAVSNSVDTIFDTSTAKIHISNYFFEDLLTHIFAHVGSNEWEVVFGKVVSRCHDFPILYFMFDGVWLQVNPSDYVIDTSQAQDESVCELLLTPVEGRVNIMGLPLFNGYYTIHEVRDDDPARMGFVPNSLSSKPAPVKGT